MEPSEAGVSAKNPTVLELDDLVDQIFDQKQKIEEMGAALTEENKRLAQLEFKAAAWLDEIGRETYKGKRGSISIKEKWSFALPKSDEDKQAFFSWMKEKGIFDKYATVHATSYNTLVNEEWEIAKQEGRGMEFSIPGVPEPRFVRLLSTRKGR